MFFLLFIASLLFAPLPLHSQPQNQTWLVDSIRGSVYVGAFADALGAAWELQGMAAKSLTGEGGASLKLAPLCAHYTEAECHQQVADGNPWAIWVPNVGEADPVKVFGVQRGVSTDDTAERLTILARVFQSWPSGPTEGSVASVSDLINYASQQPLPAPGETFKTWWNVDQFTTTNKGSRSNTEKPHKLEMINRADLSFRIEMEQDLLVMSDEANIPPMPTQPRQHGSNIFYLDGNPACFGLYLYLQAAPAQATLSQLVVLEEFYRGDGLDQGYGHVVTAIMANVAAQAALFNQQETPQKPPFATWFYETLREGINILRSLPNVNTTEIDTVQNSLDLATTTMQPWPTTASKFQDKYTQKVFRNATVGPPPSNELYNSDPLAQLILIDLSLQWTNARTTTPIAISETGAEPSFPEFAAIALCAWSAGDSDTTASFLGIILGAFHGAEALATVAPLVDKQMPLVEGFIEEAFPPEARMEGLVEALVGAAAVNSR